MHLLTIYPMRRFWRKFRQGLDRAIYEGRFKQFVWLGGVVVLAFFVLWGLACICDLGNVSTNLSSGAGPSSRAVRVIELLLDPGAFVGSKAYGAVAFQLFVVLIGAVLFTSFLIGAIGNLLSRRIESLTNGQYTYNFEDHILILGSSSILVSLVEQLGDISQDVVILTERDPELFERD